MVKNYLYITVCYKYMFSMARRGGIEYGRGKSAEIETAFFSCQ